LPQEIGSATEFEPDERQPQQDNHQATEAAPFVLAEAGFFHDATHTAPV